MTKTILIQTLLISALLSTQVLASDFSDHIRPAHQAQKVPPLVFEDVAGTQHTLADYRGSFVLLNIWATWCGPCRKEMPSLEALQKNFDPTNLHIIPLSEDRSDTLVISFYKSGALTHLPVAIDHAGTAPSALHLRGLPTSILIDREGNEVARVEGEADWSSAEVIDYLKAQMR